MNRFYQIALFGIMSLLAACQKGNEPGVVRMGQEDVGNPVVLSSEGETYSVDCLRSNAAIIQTQGKAAVDTCKVNLASSASESEIASRGKMFHGSSNYAWIYYPPTYYNSNSYTYNYPSTYSPYNDNTYNNNAFCKFVFGGNYNFNCYYIFGYTNNQNYNYSNYYVNGCDYCLYASNPTRCTNRCYRTYYY